jgi:hypothetical protein
MPTLSSRPPTSIFASAAVMSRVSRELECDSATYAAAGAGHERDLARQLPRAILHRRHGASASDKRTSSDSDSFSTSSQFGT